MQIATGGWIKEKNVREVERNTWACPKQTAFRYRRRKRLVLLVNHSFGVIRHIRKDRRGNYRSGDRMKFRRFNQRLNWVTVAGISFFTIAWGRILEDYFPSHNTRGNILVMSIGIGLMVAGAYRSAR